MESQGFNMVTTTSKRNTIIYRFATHYHFIAVLLTEAANIIIMIITNILVHWLLGDIAQNHYIDTARIQLYIDLLIHYQLIAVIL